MEQHLYNWFTRATMSRSEIDVALTHVLRNDLTRALDALVLHQDCTAAQLEPLLGGEPEYASRFLRAADRAHGTALFPAYRERITEMDPEALVDLIENFSFFPSADFIGAVWDTAADPVRTALVKRWSRIPNSGAQLPAVVHDWLVNEFSGSQRSSLMGALDLPVLDALALSSSKVSLVLDVAHFRHQFERRQVARNAELDNHLWSLLLADDVDLSDRDLEHLDEVLLAALTGMRSTCNPVGTALYDVALRFERRLQGQGMGRNLALVRDLPPRYDGPRPTRDNVRLLAQGDPLSPLAITMARHLPIEDPLWIAILHHQDLAPAQAVNLLDREVPAEIHQALRSRPRPWLCAAALTVLQGMPRNSDVKQHLLGLLEPDERDAVLLECLERAPLDTVVKKAPAGATRTELLKRFKMHGIRSSDNYQVSLAVLEVMRVELTAPPMLETYLALEPDFDGTFGELLAVSANLGSPS